MRGEGSIVGHIPGACGAVAFAAIAGGIGCGVAGSTEFSPLLNYVSELALPGNDMAFWLNAGFIAGGALATAFLLSLALGADDRGVRRAAGFGSLGAVGLIGVGLFPVTAGAPHFWAAGVAMLFSFVGSMHLFSARERPPVFSALLAVQLFCVAGAAVYLTVELITKDTLSLASHIAITGTLVNPYCVFEWGFVGTVALLLLGVSAADIVARRATSPVSLSRRGRSHSRSCP